MQRTTGAPEQAKPDVKLKKKSKEKDGTGAKRKLKDKDEAGTKKSRRKSVVPGGVSPRTEAASPFKPNALDPKVNKGHVTPEKKRVSTPAMIDPVKAAKEASTLGDITVAQKWKMPVLKKLPGDVKGAGFFDGSLGGFSGGTRRSSDTSMSSRAPQPTLAILTEIAQSKKRRMEQELRDKLNGISERVNKALLNAGFDVNEDNITFDRKQAGTFQLMSVEARSKREKVDYRNNVTSNIHEYYGACKERLNILDQVSTWIGYTQDDLERDLVPDEEYMNAITLNEQSYHDTSNAMFFYTDTTERLKTISQLVLKHIRRILDKKDRHVATKIIVMDDHTLLSSKVKWDTGVAAITHLIDDAIKWVKAIQLKAALRNGKKQYAFLVKAIDKRLLDLANTTKNYEETKTKLNTSIAKEEGFLKDQSDARREILNLQNTLDDLNNQIKMSKDRNEKLLIKVGKLEIQVRDLKDELAKPPPSPPAIIVPEPNPELLAAPPVPKTPTPPPPPPQEPTVNVEARERIEQLEDQINDYQITISELQDRIAMLENSVVKEQNKIKMMRAALDKSNKMLSQAQMSAPPAVTVAPELKMDIKMDIQPDAGSGSGSGSGGAAGGGQEAANAFKLSEASANYYKTLLSGMKNDFMQEMDRLKEHVKKEGNRTEAAVRRTENVHKDQIAVIQKDAMRILRALMHFRDQVAVALEKEGHAEPATQLRALPKLIPDDIGTDAKDILSHMSGSVVEFLHSVESILNHTLMTIRIMSKFTGGPGNEGGFMKQIVDRVEKMKTAKAVSKASAHRLRTKKRTMIKKKEDFQADQSEDKYSALMGRYKIVWNMFLSMTKEMDILEEDFEDTLEKVAENVDPLFISAMKLEAKRLREKQKALAAGENIKLKEGEGVDTKTQKPDTKFQYILRIRHHRQNIKILDKALDEKKITFELYEKSKNSLKTGITLCEKRFHLLVQRYKTFKDLQTSNVKGKKLLNGDVYLPTAKRPDLQKLLKKIETRLSEDYKFQQTIRDTALEEQNTVTKDIWTMCNHVLAQTNVELILPVVIQIKESSEGYILPMISHRQKDRMQNILNRRKALEKLRLPPILQGSNITLRNKLFYTHFKQEVAKPVNAMVTTPVVVDMDVNKERNAAKKTLTNTEKREVSLAKTRSYHVTQDWRVNFINEILYT